MSRVLVIGDTHCFQLEEFPSYYVSRCGKVASIKNGFVKTRLNKDGYETVGVYRPGCRTHIPQSVHRLVAKTFVCNQLGKPHVNHKNGIKTDNSADNLEWVTAGENNKHAYSIGLKSAIGSKNGRSKLSEWEVGKIKMLLAIGKWKQCEIAKLFCVSRQAITLIKTNSRWAHV